MQDFFLNTKKYYKYVIYAGKSQLKSEVAEAHLSWLWWILDPLLFMLVYAFMGLVIFGKGEPYFTSFIFIGYTSFKFFESVVKTSVKIIQANKSIIAKVFLPKYILIFIEMYVQGFKTLIAYVLVIISMLLYRVPITWNVFNFIPLVIVMVLFTFGVSLIFMHFGVYVQDLSNAINVALRLLFYLSGIFYSLPKRMVEYPFWSDVLLKANPLAFIIDQMRNALLYGEPLNIGVYMIWLAISVVLILLGLRLVRKNENSYVKVI